MRKTILLADDSVTIRKVVELTFMDEDFELISVGSGEEAVERLAESRPDLVIADLHMPGVDGFEVCQRAKELDAGRPVLLLVGTYEPFDSAQLEESLADAHLKKPFDSQELLRRVRELLADDRASGDFAETTARGEVESTPAESEPRADASPGEDPSGEPSATAGEPMAAPEEPQIPESLPAAARDALVDAESSSAEAGPEAAGRMPARQSDNGGGAELSQETIERIARRVVEILGPEILRDVAWEVIPDLAEVVIKERLRELEGQVE